MFVLRRYCICFGKKYVNQRRYEVRS